MDGASAQERECTCKHCGHQFRAVPEAKHRVMCGDATVATDVEELRGGEEADLCATSPPYGQQRDYTEASADSTSDWDALMRGVFGILPMADDGQVLVNLGLIHRDGEWIPYWQQWIDWMRTIGWRRFGWYVWDQGSGLPGDWNGRLAPSFEFVWHFNRQSVRPKKTVETTEQTRKHKGQSRPVGFRKEGGSKPFTSPEKGGQDWKIPDSVLRVNRSPIDGRMHPATFPVNFAVEIQKCWPGLVYDPFLGSGTTLIAAEKLGRVCYGMEIEPRYVDVIRRRYAQFVGDDSLLPEHADPDVAT